MFVCAGGVCVSPTPTLLNQLLSLQTFLFAAAATSSIPVPRTSRGATRIVFNLLSVHVVCVILHPRYRVYVV